MSNNAEIIKKAGFDAYEYEKTYHGCAQCVLKALQENLDLRDILTFKAASSLGGGVARMGEICGALLGGIMTINLAFGRDALVVSSESPEYQRAHQLSAELSDRFQAKHGGLCCRDVQRDIFGKSFDMRNPSEREKFLSAGAHEKCPEVAREAATLAAEIILREREKDTKVR